MIKNRAIATRIDARTLSGLKKLFPNESLSQILRTLAEERISIHRNAENLYAAKKVLKGKKSRRDLL